MTPGKLNIDLYAFASFTLPLVWTAAGLPVDLTGWKARMQIRERTSSATPVIDLDNGLKGGIEITAPLTGAINIKITDEQTGLLTIKAGVHDIVLESPGGDSHRILEGTVTIHPGVTKP